MMKQTYFIIFSAIRELGYAIITKTVDSPHLFIASFIASASQPKRK
ncbi:hypothetical protein HMPREF1985_01338 [Mitsuokella sp. oral taxon 131 str. W9106]|nr:hypothetical protein HMPREF1985_01338 [Mitsuokella sp. oral taxon 131 str. W9106]